mmetsp:Transcript_35343/g.57272  ORF Transcript_35343/g.57272 Transcript_35343/m.57272 type:complete len:95 (-) Transcript_35343:831-1115(-)
MLCTATLLVAAPNVLETESRLQNLLHQISVLVTAENAKYYERMDTSVSTANKPTGSKTKATSTGNVGLSVPSASDEHTCTVKSFMVFPRHLACT